MPTRRESFSNVEAEAKRLLGERASVWLTRPSRWLDGMTPTEMAQSPEGAWVVLRELRGNPPPLRRALRRTTRLETAVTTPSKIA